MFPRLHYLRLIGEDTTMFETNKFEEKKERDRVRLENREASDNTDNNHENGSSDNKNGHS